MNNNKRYQLTIFIGSIILVLGILAALLTPLGEQIASSGIITIGLVMIVIGVIGLMKKRTGVEKDELTRKIADRAAAYSWFFTLIALMIIYWLDYFKLVDFGVKTVIGLTYMVMIISMLLTQRILWRRGDVE